MEQALDRPDITLTLDGFGVIVDAVASRALAEETLDGWRGQSWKDTVAPDAGQSVSRLFESSRHNPMSACIQVTQRLPSGREAPFEYTMISLGKTLGFVAIGRNLQAMADLQSRLADAQQDRERDYWKLRDIETRYRAVLDASSDAVVLVRSSNLRVVEANVQAVKALKLVPGADFLPDLSPRNRKALETVLENVRAQGRAPGIVLHLAPDSQWSLRASQIVNQAGNFYLFQLAPIGGAAVALDSSEPISLDDVIQRFPDAFALVDREGIVRRANYAFLDLAQVGVEDAVLGRSLKHWLSQPGADASVLLGLVNRHGSVRKMLTRLEGELGSSADVEISAVGNRSGHVDYVGMILRDAPNGGPSPVPAGATDAASDALKLPDATLEEIVREATEAIERRGIQEAIAKNRGNRTLAAKYLGISRQSLHAKLRKYRFDPI